MPDPIRKPPTYRLHKPTGQAVVRIDGRDYYLGPHGSPESQPEVRPADRRVARHRPPCPQPTATGPTPTDGRLTVNELILAYWDGTSQAYYVKDGRPTSEQDNIRQALRFLRELYGAHAGPGLRPAGAEGRPPGDDRGGPVPHADQQGRQPHPGDVPLGRRGANCSRRRSTRPSGPSPGCGRAAPRPGRSRRSARCPTTCRGDPAPPAARGGRDGPGPAADRDAAAGGHRSCGPATSTDPTRRAGSTGPAGTRASTTVGERVIFLGPRAQSIIGPFLAAAGDGYLFSPKRSEEARNAEKRATRDTPRWPSHCKRKREGPAEAAAREHYTRYSYRGAIRRACVRAGVTPWHPHMIRHSAATDIRKHYGLEASQAVLGHAELGVTQVYAERDMEKAREVMRAVG